MLRFVQILYFDFEIAVAGFFMEESESLARVLEPRPRLCLLQAWLNSFFAHLVHFFLPHCGSACCFLSADQLRLLLLFTLFYCCYSVVQRVFIFGWTKNIVRLGCLLSGGVFGDVIVGYKVAASVRSLQLVVGEEESACCCYCDAIFH